MINKMIIKIVYKAIFIFYSYFVSKRKQELIMITQHKALLNVLYSVIVFHSVVFSVI